MASGEGSSYEEIMCLGQAGSGGGAHSLGSRLVSFRKWLTEEAHCSVHPNVCVVNGEATDGTKNAPVLLFGPAPSEQSSTAAAGAVGAGEGRCGVIDEDNDRALYDRTMGCQVRVAKELKKDEVMMTIPRCSMITPDVVAASDAGRAVLACCKATGSLTNFWDAFENTAAEEKRFAERVSSNSGTQVLVKILQERKKAEKVLAEAERSIERGASPDSKLAAKGAISTRAAVLAFLLHQRFADGLNPAVASKEVPMGSNEGNGNAAEQVACISVSAETPETFGPYSRTLPSYISLPICWKRNELALLAGCIPGLVPLQEVAARTMQLSSDLIALVEGGILHRFPHIFPRGMITWDRWVWAASCFTSRALPASCYFNRGEKSAEDHVSREGELFYSPPEVWNELGVMIPLLDMLNHESEASQVRWESPGAPISVEDRKESENNGGIAYDNQNEHAEVIIDKKVKKGCQVYTNYGLCNNQNFILQYGFAQINNPSDEVRIGWGLMDAVGGVAAPADYNMLSEDMNDADSQYLVFKSSEPLSINRWWTESRLVLLEEEARVEGILMANLKAGRKLNITAYGEGVYDPIFLSAAVVATMPPQGVRDRLAAIRSDQGETNKKRPTLSKRHQRVLRQYIIYLFSRKLEKLLQNLSNGLKDHFNNVELWTKATSGGLAYNATLAVDGVEENGSANYIGWQHFFDSFAYSASMEVEKRYYAMGSDSCVLSLYDGNLRSLQATLDGALSMKEFEAGTSKQLLDLGYVLSEDDEDMDDDDVVMSGTHEEDEVTGDDEKPAPEDPQNAVSSSRDCGGHVTTESMQEGKDTTEEHDERKAAALDRSRSRRIRKKGDRPPAIKLHIGNLSYQTTPSSLFDFFAGIHGKDNVLECHIPTERDSGRSRGFGFVTMPEEAATQALQSDKPHEIDGRLLKLAESNTAGSGRKNQLSSSGGGTGPSDRCSTCGYRPKYCTCSVPNVPGGGNCDGGTTGPHPPDETYVPPQGGVTDHHEHGPQYGRHNPDYDSHSGGRRRSRSWNNRGRSASRSPSPWSSGGGGGGGGGDGGGGGGGGRGGYHRDGRYHGRGRRSYRGRSYSRSRSRSYSRSRDRDRERDRRDRDRGRASDRDRDSRSSGRRGVSSRSSGGVWASRSSRSPRYGHSQSRSNSRSRSYGKGSPSRRGGDRERKSNGAGADTSEKQRGRNGRSHSASPSTSHARTGAGSGGGSDKKREGKSRNRSRSRSRSRGRSGRRKRSCKDRHRKESSKRHSRSRSWSKGG